MAKHATAGAMLVAWLRERLWSYQVVEDASVSHDRRVFEWGLTVNQNQKKDYIRKQLRKDTSSLYEKARAFYNSPRNFSAGPLARGCTYKRNFAYTRLSLSLSLSLSPPLEERARGEVGGSWTLIGSNHPTAIFGQRVPYPAGVWIVISSHRTVYSHPALFTLLVRIHSEARR